MLKMMSGLLKVANLVSNFLNISQSVINLSAAASVSVPGGDHLGWDCEISSDFLFAVLFFQVLIQLRRYVELILAESCTGVLLC